MRVWFHRHLGMVFLVFFLSLGLVNCASDQESQQGLEELEQGQQGQAGDEEYSEEDYEENGEYANQEGYEYGNQEGGNLAEFGNQGYENNALANNGGNLMGNEGNLAMNDGAANVEANMGANGAGEMIPVDDGAGVVADVAGGAGVIEGINPPGTSPTAGTYVGGMAGVSAGPGLPEIGSKMPYIVQAGETLGMIAAKIYGVQSKWRDISKLTGLVNPNRIYPGDLVYYQLTDEAVAFASSYENATRGEITVNAGDTLASVARQIYGTNAKWKELWRHNDQINNPDVLTAGQVVYYVAAGALASNDKVEKSASELSVEVASLDLREDLTTSLDGKIYKTHLNINKTADLMKAIVRA